MLKDVKLLLGIEGTERDKLLSLLILNAERQVLGQLQAIEPTPVVVPDELAFIIPELVVARYNRIGSEGLSQHSVEGETSTYLSDDFSAYDSAIARYVESKGKSKTGVVKFL